MQALLTQKVCLFLTTSIQPVKSCIYKIFDTQACMFLTHSHVASHPQDLREECLKLRTRVFDLEQQNRALSVLFQQRIKPASDLLLQVRRPLRCSHLEAATDLSEARRFSRGITEVLYVRNTAYRTRRVMVVVSAGT